MNSLVKRIGYFLLVSLVSLAIFGSPSSAEENPFSIISANESVTMTVTADPKGMKVATLKPGTRVKLVRQEESWSKIEYNGRLGWVRQDVLKPFTEDLLPIYSSYYKLLDTTEHVVYALVADFTQDGIEDLFMIVDSNPTKGQYIEMIYSGDTVIYQKHLKYGLSVLKDSTDYYLFHHSQKNTDKSYKLSELNKQAQIDYLEVSEGKSSYEIGVNHYLMSYYIVQAGNGKVHEQTFTHEQAASKDAYGSDKVNEYGENIYLENYSLSSNGQTKTLLEKDYKELFALYEKSKGAKIIYRDDGNSAALSDKFTFDLKRAKEELLRLATDITVQKPVDVLDSELNLLKLKLAQSVVLEMPYENGISRNALTLVKNVENGITNGLAGYEASYFTKAKLEFPIDGMAYTERTPIDQVIYDFYGTTVNADEFNALASIENRYLDKDYYQYPLEEAEKSNTYIYRQLQSVEQLESGYDVLEFVDYEMPVDIAVSESNENALIAGEKVNKGYVVLKRLPFKSETKWIYVDTVSHIDLMNEKHYATYENTLSVVQRFVAEQQIVEPNDEEVRAEEMVVASAAVDGNRKQVEVQDTKVPWGVLAAMFLLASSVFGGAYYVYRRKIEQ